MRTPFVDCQERVLVAATGQVDLDMKTCVRGQGNPK